MKQLFNKSANFYKLILSFALAFVVVVLFQNCSPANSFSSESSQNKIAGEGGNGSGYDGKIQDFTRLVPGLTCDNNQIAIGSLILQENSALIITNENSCQNISKEVPLTDLEFSSFANKYIGYDGGVYTMLKNKEESIQKRIFTEAWCRALKPDNTGSELEFAIEWQETGRIAKMATYTVNSLDPEMMNATRIIDFDSLFYHTNKGSLKIDLNKKNPNNKKSIGRYSGYIDNNWKEVNVECLMGGQFDLTAPEFNYRGQTDLTIPLGESLTSLIPNINKKNVSFSINEELPKGIIFDAKTGIIQGTPTSISARKKYAVSAKFDFGEITRIVSIGVGLTQLVDQYQINSNVTPCLDRNLNCDLAGAVEAGNQMAPIPLIIKITVPNIRLMGQNLNITGDLFITGLPTKTEIDASLLSRHFKISNKGILKLENLKLINGKDSIGGSLFSSDSMISIVNTSFINNLADDTVNTGQGGALYAVNSSLEIINSDFTANNTRRAGTNVYGGAIYIKGGLKTSIRKTNFTNNSSADGGGIYLDVISNQSVEITDCNFIENKSFQGAAINSKLSNLYITKTNFLRNESIFDGGAINFLWSQKSWIIESNFEGNKSGGFGSSAIYWTGSSAATNHTPSSLYIIASHFTKHRGSLYSNTSVIYNNSGKILLKNSSLTDNGILKSCYTPFNSENSIFLSAGGNHSDDGTCPN